MTSIVTSRIRHRAQQVGSERREMRSGIDAGVMSFDPGKGHFWSVFPQPPWLRA
jgi:hypothetical protein